MASGVVGLSHGVERGVPLAARVRETVAMEYARLGRSGLTVSRVGLGCMSYGQAASGMHKWTLDEDAAGSFFRQAVELGVTFWDTANVYQSGTSEEYVGRAIRRYSRREDIVLATKVSGKMHDGPGGSGLSRKAILEQLDESLRRLDTDYVDVYYVHRFDEQVPVEETVSTLHDVVRAGKVRYLGASSMWAWQFAKMQYAAEMHAWTTFAAMEDQYNVLKREEERDMIPLCLDRGVGLTPYSPLAKGRAARPWGEQTTRSSTDAVALLNLSANPVQPSTSASKSAFVAEIKRTSPRRVFEEPTRSNSPVSNVRSSFACCASGTLPISSRNRLPPSASSNRPARSVFASVKAPLT